MEIRQAKQLLAVRDRRQGQLLAVIDDDGKPVEQYAYDPAGNILSKTVNGKTTTFTYDKANQLVSSTLDGKTTDYRYDGAGRLVKEGDKTYQYGYLDKILNVLENGENIAGFDYHIGGQIASSITKDGTENFLWDGLALIHRGDTNYINEPAITGGNPILAGDNVLFNDMLGTTLGVKSGEGFNQIAMTAFGDTENKDAFFTGKPIVGEIGYVFLFRAYRADQGKWQTQDPYNLVFIQYRKQILSMKREFCEIGYPDGWNNLAYVNNEITSNTDYIGLCTNPGCASASSKTEKQDIGYLATVTAQCGEKKEESGIMLISLAPGLSEAFNGMTSLIFSWKATNDLSSHPFPHSGALTLVYHAIMSWRITTTTYACGMESQITLSHGAVMETVVGKSGGCIHE